jgi:hypothetical protein
MGGQDRVVGFNHGSGNLRSRVDGEFQLGLLSIVDRETFHQERGESRSGATTEGVEDQESLESSALISQLPDPVQDEVDNLLSNGVMSTGIVVGGILLASHQLLRVEQLTVGASTDFINDRGFKINKDGTGDMLAGSSFSKEGAEGVIPSGLVGWHLTIRLDSMLKAVQFPTGITDLASGLADMNRDTFTLKKINKSSTYCYCFSFAGWPKR